MSRVIATFLYSGYLRPAPGTWGSLAALPAAWVIGQWAGFLGLVFATLIVCSSSLKEASCNKKSSRPPLLKALQST